MDITSTTRTRRGFDDLKDKVSRSSWGAIFAGALTALAVAFLLNLLGLGIGLTSINPMTESDPLAGLGTGTIIWWGLSNLVALFVGGMVAGRMSGFPSSADGGLHGFLAWALYTIITFYFLTSTVGSIMNGMGNIVSGLFGSNNQSKQVTVKVQKAQEQSQNQANFSIEKAKQQVLQVVNTAEKYNIVPEDASSETRQVLENPQVDPKGLIKSMEIEQFFNDLSFNMDNNGNLNIELQGDGDYVQKEELKDYLTNNTQLSESEIDGMIQKWEANIQQAIEKAEKAYADAKQKAIELSDKITDAIGKFSIIAFGVLLLGALAAFFGGSLGSPKYTVNEGHRIKEAEDDDHYRKDRR